MNTSERRAHAPSRLALSGRARDISFGDETLVVDLEDGRQIAVPIAWFPRLATSSAAQRSNWELVGRGIGIHWPDIDEDISVENLLGAHGELLMARVRPTDLPARAAESELTGEAELKTEGYQDAVRRGWVGSESPPAT